MGSKGYIDRTLERTEEEGVVTNPEWIITIIVVGVDWLEPQSRETISITKESSTQNLILLTF